MKKTLILFIFIITNVIYLNSQNRVGYATKVDNAGFQLSPIGINDGESASHRPRHEDINIHVQNNTSVDNNVNNSRLSIIKLKLLEKVKQELPKQRTVYPDYKALESWYLDVVDVKQTTETLFVEGEFTYIANPDEGSSRLKFVTVKYTSQFKQLLDEYTITSIMYEYNGIWVQLFPTNKF